MARLSVPQPLSWLRAFPWPGIDGRIADSCDSWSRRRLDFQFDTRQTRPFFLEIVQRDNYIAFGPRNASARMAAQAREYEHIQDLLLNYESPEPD